MILSGFLIKALHSRILYYFFVNIGVIFFIINNYFFINEKN